MIAVEFPSRFSEESETTRKKGALYLVAKRGLNPLCCTKRGKEKLKPDPQTEIAAIAGGQGEGGSLLHAEKGLYPLIREKRRE